MSIDKGVLSKLNDWLEKKRTRNGLMAIRMVFIGPKGGLNSLFESSNEACTGVFNRNTNVMLDDGTVKYLTVAFNGQEPADLGSGGVRGLPYDSNIFEGGEISEAWLGFLLDPTGIWKDVIPYIVNADDVDDINYRTGFIFRDPHDLPAEATFNFLIASRFAQEQNRKAVVWYELVQKGVNPRIAFIYATWYNEHGGLLSTPIHSIGYSPPKVWAKNFYLGKPYESAKSGSRSTPEKTSLAGYGTTGTIYGLKGVIGENQWLCHRKTPSGSMSANFFCNMKTGATRDEILKDIELFVTSEGE